jgi:hypothetical protein
MIHPIGSPSWFEAVGPKRKKIAMAWLLGAKVQWKATHSRSAVWILIYTLQEALAAKKQYWPEGSPLEPALAINKYVYRLAP